MENDFLNDLQFDLGAMEKLFNPLSTGILVTDFLGSILYINPFFSEITGYEPEEIIGENYHFFQSERYETDHCKTMWEDLKKNSFCTGKTYFVKRNGEVSPFWVSSYKIFDLNNIYFISFYSEFHEMDY
ncbi:MAG: PAS domain-containing protein [Pseudomonadota bacterium]